MITISNFSQLLDSLKFKRQGKVYTKMIYNYELGVDFEQEKLIYPAGLIAQRDTTKNFSQPENFVIFECVHNLLQSGYQPEHIILEQGMPGGHGMTGGFCDIIVQDNDKHPYLLIECKTADNVKSKGFSRAWAKMQKDGGQLFNYYNSYRQAKWLCLYTSNFVNGQAESIYHLISMSDNPKYLGNNENLLSFEKVQSENGSKSDYFKVWRETYQQDFISHNLFESAAFNIGNRPYNIRDLKIVDNNTIQKKYHQFATIMRQHNVSARENAFDKLVNLFLCKVVDEKANPENLKVYWKGATSDNHYDLQDRLQQLYQIGMKEFLGEDVTYISAETLDDAFHLFKNKKDETKRTVMEYFTQLKFYSNNPFAFLDVHNEKLFFQNAIILKEIVQMLQDIKLKNEEEQHQFLGDLFEGFLDQGVKQSEGQFFTPMPIVKFLISSLPLTELLQNEKAPKVIDYACGAGHFLTEYASQIKPLLKSGQNPTDFYQRIYGIEKEYRLSKVAKVSAFMYGQDEMNIIYADALANNKDLKEDSFSLLVANPPYSVKGFLATLSEEDKSKFTLYQHVSDEDIFNSIETFFIEKAKQLLHSGGIAVIVLPSSILTNGNIYIKCREIILQYFDLVAITEFGSGTFGKTGTNTVTLFLRRKSNKPILTDHYQNRVAQWKSGNFSFDGLFEDIYLLQAYCQHCGFDLVQYQAFLTASDKMPSEIARTQVFQEYKKVFDKKKFSKNTNLEKEWLNFTKEIEADKLHYFMLAQSNPQKVLVIKMPSETREKKAFLGYEWSSAKGNEGIKYITSQNNENTSNEEELSYLQGINKIQTPLFNPQNMFDESKLNNLVRQNFLGYLHAIPAHLTSFASLLPLNEMLDLRGAEFDKIIRTSVKQKFEIQSKYELKTIAEITVTIESGKRPNGGVGSFTEGAYSLGGEHIGKDNGRLELSSIKYVPQKFFDEAKRGIIKKLDILICKDGALTGKVALVRDELEGINAMINEHVFILRCSEIDTQKYLFNYLFSEYGQMLLKNNITGAAQGGLNSKNLKSIRIPFPPLDIQKEISKKCEYIDDEFNRTRMEIEEYRAKITQIFNDLETTTRGGVKRFKINELCSFNPSKTEIKTLFDDLIVSFVEMSSVSNKGFIETKIDKTLGELRKGSYTYFGENDIIIAKITPCMENGKCALATGLSNHIGIGSSEFHVFRADENKILPAFLFYSLNREIVRKEAEKHMTGSSGHRRVPISFYQNFQISVPNLETQKIIITQITDFENKIFELETKISTVNQSKKVILDKYLN